MGKKWSRKQKLINIFFSLYFVLCKKSITGGRPNWTDLVTARKRAREDRQGQRIYPAFKGKYLSPPASVQNSPERWRQNVPSYKHTNERMERDQWKRQETGKDRVPVTLFRRENKSRLGRKFPFTVSTFSECTTVAHKGMSSGVSSRPISLLSPASFFWDSSLDFVPAHCSPSSVTSCSDLPIFMSLFFFSLFLAPSFSLFLSHSSDNGASNVWIVKSWDTRPWADMVPALFRSPF